MGNGAGEAGGNGGQRLDKWLWFARIIKSRTLAAALIEDGKIKVNKVRAVKASQIVKPGDVIISTAQRRIRILKLVDPGVRRGPAAEAQRLYEDLTPPEPVRGSLAATTRLDGEREAGSGRPTKRDRRLIDRFKSLSEE